MYSTTFKLTNPAYTANYWRNQYIKARGNKAKIMEARMMFYENHCEMVRKSVLKPKL